MCGCSDKKNSNSKIYLPLSLIGELQKINQQRIDNVPDSEVITTIGGNNGVLSTSKEERKSVFTFSKFGAPISLIIHLTKMSITDNTTDVEITVRVMVGAEEFGTKKISVKSSDNNDDDSWTIDVSGSKHPKGILSDCTDCLKEESKKCFKRCGTDELCWLACAAWAVDECWDDCWD